jgi:hypothetical protein
MTPKLEKQIVKYINKCATTKDIDTLSEWIQEPNNKRLFKEYVKTHYIINYSMNDPEKSEVIEKLLNKIRKEKPLIYKLKKQSILNYVAAAVIIGIISTTFFFKNNLLPKEEDKTIISNIPIQSGSDKAILTLDNGATIALEKGKKYKDKKRESDGEQLIYQDKKVVKEEIAYNYLTVPRGGQFQITLSDGTRVWLNSESQLKYPVSFQKGKYRKVELIYGEAYFEVSRSENHSGDGFKVMNHLQEVEVLGTHFNIKAYKVDHRITTTLKEGKVLVKNNQLKKFYLKPNQQLILNKLTSEVIIKDVNAEEEISWVKGYFNFNNVSLDEITKVLSRWYDVDITTENEEIKDVRFNGVLSKKQDIEFVLKAISNTSNINYEIKNKNIKFRK